MSRGQPALRSQPTMNKPVYQSGPFPIICEPVKLQAASMRRKKRSPLCKELTRMIEQTQPLLEQSGTSAQRATFLAHVAMRDAVRDHYVVAPATLSTCQMGISAAVETGDPHLIGATRFVMGYCFFLSGKFE